MVFQELRMVVSGLTSAVQESTYLLIAFCQSLEGQGKSWRYRNLAHAGMDSTTLSYPSRVRLSLHPFGIIRLMSVHNPCFGQQKNRCTCSIIPMEFLAACSLSMVIVVLSLLGLSRKMRHFPYRLPRKETEQAVQADFHP